MESKVARAYAALQDAQARGICLGLSRMVALMERLGNPQNAVPAVHIAGTNGKGSVGTMIASVLPGLTGHFSSPGLYGMKSCLRLGGKTVSDERFAEAVLKADEAAASMKEKPTAYELLTAAAFVLFRDAGCTVSVIECCMGGDTDCTNVLEKPLLSVITNVQKDHCDFLGKTIEEIAGHKAGIIKPGCPVLAGLEESPAKAGDVVRERARALHAPLFVVNAVLEDVKITPAGMDFVYHDPENGAYSLHLPLVGVYQRENARCALRAVEILRQNGLSIEPGAIRCGFEKCRIEGRFEILGRHPEVLFDGAHNPAGMRAAAESLGHYFGERKVLLLTGVMADKEWQTFPDILKPHVAKVFAVRPSNSRAMEAREWAAAFEGAGLPARHFSSFEEGVRAAYTAAWETDTPLAVMGSLYLYREFREIFDKIKAPA